MVFSLKFKKKFSFYFNNHKETIKQQRKYPQYLKTKRIQKENPTTAKKTNIFIALKTLNKRELLVGFRSTKIIILLGNKIQPKRVFFFISNDFLKGGVCFM